MKKIDYSQFKVKDDINLQKTSTTFDLGKQKKKIEKHLEKTRVDLGKWQDKLYAHSKYSVLVCLQGMDTSGKDSAIREVFKDFNSRGVVVHSFKVPSALELKHDFLWRHNIALPARGKFGVFNRTHYENVLITRVHPEYILNENLPGVNDIDDINDAFWEKRFEQIRNFEEHLAENGTIIFKFFLHISKEEQRERLLRRLEEPDKNWKFSPGDLKERKLWDEYQNRYQDAFNRTSRPHAPWYVIPADDKATTRYLMANILLEELLKYKDIQEPAMDPKLFKNLENYKDQLTKD
ncbi:MAG TPA: PPK2 family polyphosphate kinase [Gillisia sp.]|nr:PPK2 family polyphosphate kinase [Gillisia sp.]